MKKKSLLLFLLLIPIRIVMASNYGIENYFFNVTIEDNGDVLVEEYFEMNGDFNGMERIIEFQNYSLGDLDPEAEKLGGTKLNNADSMQLLEIRGLPYQADFNFTNIKGDLFEETSYAYKGEYGVYTIKKNWYNEKYMIYNPSEEHRAFYLKYRLKNMAVLHDDYGELYWNIPIDELKESIANLKAIINIPNNKEVKTWAHGPLNGEVKIIEPTKVEAVVNGVNERTAMDVRVIFDRNVIKHSQKKSNIKALDKILAFEEEKAEEANAQRKLLEKENEERAENYIKDTEKKLNRNNYEQAKY